MNVRYLVQYKHPFHHKWVTDEKCYSLEEAQKTLNEKKNEVTEILKDRRTTLAWRILSLD